MGKTALLRRLADEARTDRAIVIYAEATQDESLASILREGLEAAQGRVESFPAKLKAAVDRVIRFLPKAEYELPGGAGSIALSGSGIEPERRPFVSLLRAFGPIWRTRTTGAGFVC